MTITKWLYCKLPRMSGKINAYTGISIPMSSTMLRSIRYLSFRLKQETGKPFPKPTLANVFVKSRNGQGIISKSMKLFTHSDRVPICTLAIWSFTMLSLLQSQKIEESVWSSLKKTSLPVGTVPELKR